MSEAGLVCDLHNEVPLLTVPVTARTAAVAVGAAVTDEAGPMVVLLSLRVVTFLARLHSVTQYARNVLLSVRR